MGMPIGDRKYFDVVIGENNTYEIVETNKKPRKRGSAEETLKKIKRVLENKENFTYVGDLTPDLAQAWLKEKAQAIVVGYENKTSKLLKTKRIRNKIGTIQALHTAINNIVSPQREVVPGLNKDVLSLVMQHVPTSSLPAVAATSRAFQQMAQSQFVVKAQQLGYKGKDEEGAVEYLKNAYKNIDDLAKDDPYPDLLVRNKKGKVNHEQSIQKLRNLPLEQFLDKFIEYSGYRVREFLSLYVYNNESKILEVASQEKLNKSLLKVEYRSEKGKDVDRFLINAGADVNQLILRGWGTMGTPLSPLMLAVRDKPFDREWVEFLLEKGARIDACNEDGYTALAFAFESRDYEVAKFLLERGASIAIKDKNGVIINRKLVYALGNSSPQIIELAYEKGMDINVQDGNGRTALSYACQAKEWTVYLSHKNFEDRLGIVNTLFKYGADPGKADNAGNKPFAYALAWVSESFPVQREEGKQILKALLRGAGAGDLL